MRVIVEDLNDVDIVEEDGDYYIVGYHEDGILCPKVKIMDLIDIISNNDELKHLVQKGI